MVSHTTIVSDESDVQRSGSRLFRDRTLVLGGNEIAEEEAGVACWGDEVPVGLASRIRRSGEGAEAESAQARPVKRTVAEAREKCVVGGGWLIWCEGRVEVGLGLEM